MRDGADWGHARPHMSQAMQSQQSPLPGVGVLRDCVGLLGTSQPDAQSSKAPAVATSDHGPYPDDGPDGSTSASPNDAGPSKPLQSGRGVGHKGSRARTGCLTCRLRKKRCDEAKPECKTCSRLGIECLGYGRQRPDWLKGENNLKQMRDEFRDKVLAQRFTRPRQRESCEISQKTQEGKRRPSPARLAQPEDQVHLDNNKPYYPPHHNYLRVSPTAGHDPWHPANGSTSLYTRHTSHLSSQSPPVIPMPASMTGDLSDDSLALFNDPEMHGIWKMIFGQEDSRLYSPDYASFLVSPTLRSPSALPDLPRNSFLSSPSSTPLMGYVHHYLTCIMPLQFRTVRSLSVGNVVGPLAFQSTEVLTSVSSLAALHLAEKRVGLLPSNGENSLAKFGDTATLAVSAHRDSLDRLKYVTADNLAAEQVIVPALFAVSYCLFKGGTSPQWREPMTLCQKCIAAALTTSPELTKEFTGSADSPPGTQTPWQRYRPLLEVMISTDIIASVSANKVTPSLAMYRVVLGRISHLVPPEQSINMLTVMGCDNVTLLAMAEATALSEWRDGEEAEGTLSHRELVKRAELIEQRLSERAWRIPHIDIDLTDKNGKGPPDEETKTYLMSQVYFAAVKLFIATIVNGPFPRVPEVANAVQESVEALNALASRYERPDILRKLVFPLTLTGCHCTTEEQRQFFRETFIKLGPEAAFGNTGSSRTLMEEVWRRRQVSDPGAKICWRQVMRDLGWEAGLLML